MAANPPHPSSPVENPLDLATFREVPANAGLSLDQLSTALTDMLATGDDPYAAPPDPSREAGNLEFSGAAADDACEMTPRSILEAMLFVGSPSNAPLTSQQVALLMRGVRPAEIDDLVRGLNLDYQKRNCPYAIVAVGAGYRLQLRERFARVRDQFYGKARTARLSQAAIEVLAAVAYHAPITAEEISRLRGVPSGAILSQLVRRQLLRLEHAEGKPRRARYVTSARFLELFGLASLDDLPRSHDLDEA